MATLTYHRNHHRLIVGTKKFRIYDCLSRGYVVMLGGAVIHTADNIVQAQQFAINYRGV